MKSELIKLLIDCIDLEKLALGLLEDVAEKALKEAVAKTATPIDDAVIAVLLPALNPAVEALIKAKVAELKASLAA
jgi:hypothetical protein